MSTSSQPDDEALQDRSHALNTRLTHRDQAHGGSKIRERDTIFWSSVGPGVFSPEAQYLLPAGAEAGSFSPVANVRGQFGNEDSYHELSGTPFLGGMSRARFRIIFGVILLEYFITFFDHALMTTIHPVISSEFHASNSASWLETAFLITSTAFQPLAARISDIIGRRPLQSFSLFVFAVTTVWCAVAQDMTSLIAARAICGLGAGGVLAMAPIMTNDLIPIRIRGTYQGYINLSVGLASACGAAFGGVICDNLGWRWAFGIQVPPIIILFALAIATTPSHLGPHLAKGSGQSIIELVTGLDLTGSLCLGLAVTCLIVGLNLGGNTLPWTHPVIAFSLLAYIVACSILIVVELRAERPVMPLKMLSTSPRAYLVFSNFFAYMGNSSILFNAPLFFQVVRLETPSISGFRLTIPLFAVTIFGFGSGIFMTRTGRMKGLILMGSLFMVLGSALMSSIRNTTLSWVATIFLVPSSIGMGLNTPATSLAVLSTSTYDDQAVMTTTLNLWRRLGAVMGVAISSLILQNVLLDQLNHQVTGAHKDEIINAVRKSVLAIFDLSPEHQVEVALACQTSLQVTFGFAVVTFTTCSLLVLFLKLPNLRSLAK